MSEEMNASPGVENAAVENTTTDQGVAAPDNTVTEVMEDSSESPKQTKEQNREFARQRREREASERIAEAEMKATFRAFKGTNPYTGEPLKDRQDYDELTRMMEMEENGFDPVSDYSRYQKDMQRKQAEKAAADEKKNQELQRQLDEFKTKYPDVDVKGLLESDQDFIEYSEGKLGGNSLTEVYEKYQGYQRRAQEKADRVAAQKLANAKAGVGSAHATKANGDGSFFTLEQVKAMSSEERKRNFAAIMESRKKW